MIVREVVHIAENRAADLYLGHSGLLRTVGKRTRAATAHDSDAVAGRCAGPGACSERGDGVANRALLLGRIGNGRGLALPACDTDEAKTRSASYLAR